MNKSQLQSAMNKIAKGAGAGLKVVNVKPSTKVRASTNPTYQKPKVKNTPLHKRVASSKSHGSINVSL